MATETERFLNGSSWLPAALRRNDLAALYGEEGQGADEAISISLQAEDVDQPAFLTAELVGNEASMIVTV